MENMSYLKVKDVIEQLKKLKPESDVYVRDYTTNSLKRISKIETNTGQINFIVY